MLAFWKGNGTNVFRVAPYAAAQLSSNDFYKRLLSGAHPLPGSGGCVPARARPAALIPLLCCADENGHLSLPGRLTCGALAGMTGTALTHPLVRRVLPRLH